MKVCVCCHSPEVITRLVELGRWRGSAYIEVPDDALVEGSPSHIVPSVLEESGFSWRPLKKGSEAGIWHTFYGRDCVNPPLQRWVTREIYTLQNSGITISGNWDNDAYKLFYEEWWPYYRKAYKETHFTDEDPMPNEVTLLVFEMIFLTKEAIPWHLRYEEENWHWVRYHKEKSRGDNSDGEKDSK